jgi:hypothetical protein
MERAESGMGRGREGGRKRGCVLTKVRFWKSEGKKLYTFPEIDSVPVDLSLLFKEVEERGGLEKVP